MNIATYFHTHYSEALLYDTDGDSPGQAWTAQLLYSHVAAISDSLTRLGVNKGDTVLVLTGNCAATYIFSLAAWNIGLVVAPLSPSSGVDLLTENIRRLAPKVCFYDNKLNVSAREALSPLCRLFVVMNAGTDEAGSQDYRYDSLLRYDASAGDFGDFPDTHPALIIHTSGSQGRPKIIQYSHKNLFNYFHYHDLIHRQFLDSHPIALPQKPLISVFQPSHLAAYSIAMQGFLQRRPTYLMRDFLPAPYLQLLAALACRLSILVPSMYVALLREVTLLASLDFSSLELCASVGEPTAETLVQRVERAFGASVFAGYGLTECLPGIAHSLQDLQSKSIKPGSCGKRLFDEVKLVDYRGLAGDSGELWLRNATVHRCYKDEEFNEGKFTADGWLKTGDLFHRDSDGDFFHQGRIDDMFICNGKNIYPAEVEFALAKHPGIEKAMVAAIVDKDGRLFPAALIQAPLSLADKEIADFYLKTGPLHAIPRFIQVVPALPQIGPGKLDRNASRRLLQQMYDGVAAGI